MNIPLSKYKRIIKEVEDNLSKEVIDPIITNVEVDEYHTKFWITLQYEDRIDMGSQLTSIVKYIKSEHALVTKEIIIEITSWELSDSND